MKKPKKGRKIFIAILLILVLIFAAGYIVPFTERVDFKPAENASDWMAEIDGKIPLNIIKIPGAHDSATRYVQLAFFSKCQALGIREQLECGFRYLDIRLGADSDKLVLMHGFTKCKKGAAPWSEKLFLDDVLEECCEFLKKHPSETVVFAVKQEYGDETVSQFQRLLDRYISENEDKWLLTDKIPSLDAARGRLLLMRRYDDEAGLGKRAGIPLLWETQSGFSDDSKGFESYDNGAYRLIVQDRYEYGVKAKRTAFLSGINKYNTDIENGALLMNFLSTKGTAPLGHPYFYAKKLDPFLLNTATGKYGWIITDFADGETAYAVYSENKAFKKA